MFFNIIPKKSPKDRIVCLYPSHMNPMNTAELEQEKETQQKRIERLESVEQENKINKDKIERQKELISRQQDKLLEQARYINRVKSSLIGKLLFKN